MLSYEYWISILSSTVSSTIVIGIIVFFSKEFIKNKLLHSIKNKYDKELEEVKALLKERELNIKNDYDEKLEELKADLKSKEQKLSTLSNGALSGISFRKTELYKLQLDATQKLWNELLGLSKAKNISSIMRAIPFDKMVPFTEKDPKARQIFKDMGSGFDLTKYDATSAEKLRLFVSPMAWAFFSAYKAIIMNDIIKYKVLEIGVGKDVLKENKTLEKLVKTTLPEYIDYIEKNANISLYDLLDILEQKLLDELNRIIEGEHNDRDAVTKAAEILSVAEEYTKNLRS